MLLVAEVVGSSIVTLHPLLDSYVSLEQRGQYTPSLLGRHIADLHETVRVMKLEQVMSSDMGIATQQETADSFIVQARKTVEQMLLAWVKKMCETDDQFRRLLSSSNIMVRLQGFQMKISDALEDLRGRCKLLGYRDELIDGNDTYMLLVPHFASHELQGALKTLQSDQIRFLPFPDQEKLIYLHTYRIGIKS